MKRIMTAVLMSVMAGAAGAAEFSDLQRLRASGMAADATAAEFSDLAVKAADLKIIAAADGVSMIPAVSKGYAKPVAPAAPIEWVYISGGKFTMGTTNMAEGFEDTKPIREVAIKNFDMSKTAVTVAQYAECVNKGGCTTPGTTATVYGDAGNYCNWGKPGRQLHPVNCVSWDQANQYAKFKGARLPSEAEWEYAARSGGKSQYYPWGDGEPNCSKVVMYGNVRPGCGADSTLPVCSKPAGNTAQGLCDMAGNVWQWVQDKYKNSYEDAPVDGSAVESASVYHVIRGGSFDNDDAASLRTDFRNFDPGYDYIFIGFRLARSR